MTIGPTRSPRRCCGRAAVLATTAYGACRLVAAPLLGRRIEYDIDITRVVMGTCMAGMLVGRLNFLDAAAWKAVLVLVAAWYAARVILAAATPGGSNRRRRLTYDAGHLLSTGAMLYAFYAPSAAPGGMPMTGSMDAPTLAPTLAPLLAVLLFAYAILLADRMRNRAGAACELVMSLAMGLMLVLGL
jgi:hypothetical protein